MSGPRCVNDYFIMAVVTDDLRDAQPNEEPLSTALQDGYTFPELALTADVLQQIGLEGDAFRFYKPGVGIWVSVRVGHCVKVSRGDSLFLAATGIPAKDMPNFDDLLRSVQQKHDHFRNNLAHERQSIRSQSHSETIRQGRLFSPPLPLSHAGPSRSRGHSSQPQGTQSRLLLALDDALASSVDSPDHELIVVSSDSDTGAQPVKKARHKVFTNVQEIIDRSRSSPPLPLANGNVVHRPNAQNTIDLTRSSPIDLTHSSPIAPAIIATPVNSYPSYNGLRILPQKALCRPRDPQWPRDFYVRDLATGFEFCQAAAQPNSGTTVDAQFEQFFGLPFKSSTYYDNFEHWDAATAAAREAAVDAEYALPQGTWKYFRQNNPKGPRQQVRGDVRQAKAKGKQRACSTDLADDLSDSVDSNFDELMSSDF